MSEPTMTIICPQPCGNQYGRWRKNCPVCGRTTPESKRVEPDQPKREAKARREPERKVNECILCRKRVKAGAKGRKRGTRCPHCNELIHERCLEYHRGDCLKFQMQVESFVNAPPDRRKAMTTEFAKEEK